MFTNKDITVFSFDKDEYTRTEIRNVFWDESIERVTTDKGIEHHKKTTVFIPLPSIPDDFTLKTGSVVIKGLVEYVPPSNNEKGFSEWHKYVKDHYNTHTVTAISINDYGSHNMQHLEVVMK